jgi:predicted enzyme related to lactoylglutathione lyase
MIPTGRFVWFDYVTKDPERAKAFFGELFHWKTKPHPAPHGEYAMILNGDVPIGGILTAPEGAPAHAHWLSFLQVENAAASAEQVKSLGGRLAKEPFAIADNYGIESIAKDPDGATFVLWQPGKDEYAAQGYSGNDHAWIWNELYSQDPEKSAAFYKAIGGFTTDTMKMNDGGVYTIIKSDDKGRGGIIKVPGVKPMWMPYVKVANTDQTVERAKKLGCDVKNVESAEGVGRFAMFLDPLGCPLGVLQPQPA